MKLNPVVAVVGATGLIGNEIVTILDDRELPIRELRLLASDESAGEIYKVAEDEIMVETLDLESFQEVDIAIFATNPQLSEQYVPLALKAGAVVIDSSGNFQLSEEDIPVVADVNSQQVIENILGSTRKLIASPNGPTIMLAPILSALDRRAPIKRVLVSTYQAVSSAGKAALDELWEQTRAVFTQKDINPEALPHQIAFNCIPQIDLIGEDGYTREEQKIITGIRRTLKRPELAITATAVRVPVFHGHGISLNIEFEKALPVEAVIEALSADSSLRVYSNSSEYPMPLDAVGTDEIHVGRIRSDKSLTHGINCWVVADNIRRGAALNAVRIVEQILSYAQH